MIKTYNYNQVFLKYATLQSKILIKDNKPLKLYEEITDIIMYLEVLSIFYVYNKICRFFKSLFIKDCSILLFYLGYLKYAV